MKILCSTEKLLKTVSSVDTIVKSKLSFSSLSNILLETREDKLFIQASNGEISQSVTIDAEIKRPGKIVLTHSKLANLLRQFPNGDIIIDIDEQNIVHLSPAKAERKLKANLLGISSDNFPTLPKFPTKEFYVLEKSYLKKMINKVIFAVSSQPTRYALHGIFFELINNQLTMVATDTRKMALFKSLLPSDKNENYGIILPHGTLAHLQKVLNDDGPINFAIDNHQIFFKFDNFEISSSLINGEFPKYQMLLPQTYESTLIANTKVIINAISAANSILENLQAPKIIWKIKKNEVTLYSKEDNYNEVNESIEVDFQGNEMEIGFNANMLLEVIRNINTVEVEINFNHETAPIIIKEKGNDELTYVVMPVKLSV